MPRAVTVRGPSRLAVRRTSLLTILFAVLLGTGTYIEFLAARNWNAGETVLVLHIVLGLVGVAMFASWIGPHVLHGLPKSQRPLFTWLSWLLLASYLLVFGTGLVMIIPLASYLAGRVWFFQFDTTGVLTFLHLWSAFAAASGLFLHLLLQHWRKPASDRRGASS
ncbi:hypothetical protein C0075_00315 [Rhizobium sp. KAs_5_22]|nr:hypothetical protein C0075_00315 [Rhizobium sp. KAs_5_22]